MPFSHLFCIIIVFSVGSIKKKKIYIPTDGDINYLGLLIGPKGQTQKQMQESSGAKILIRGRGSAKDGGASNTGHPDDDDALHVFMEGSEEAVNKATVEVEKILFDPDQAMRLKNEQLRQLANRDSDSIYGSGDSYQVELRVPNTMVGLIIGKGGENVLRIQAQLGVHCQIAKESEMKPGETQRTITIKGNPSSVDEAKKRIDDIIENHLSKFSSSRSNKETDMNCAFVVKLPVPNDKVGIIIGKGGMTIKGIQERTRTQIQIPQVPDEDNQSVRTVTIGGDTKEAIDAAQMEIFMTLQMQQQSAQNAYNASASALLVMVPDEKVGVIIGRGGATVKEIQNRFHVRIQIPQMPDIGSNPPVRTVSIMGTPEAQAAAKYEIEMIASGNASYNRDQDKYGGNYGGNAAGSSWDAQNYSYYGAAAAAAANPYAAYSYNDMAAYYAQYAAAAAAAAGTTTTAAAATSGSTDSSKAGTTATTTTAEVPTDPTTYYKDFWQYAAYYGEAAARMYYGAWSPPEGTPPPEGITVASDSTNAAATAAASTAAADSVNATTAAASSTDASSAANVDGSSATAASATEADPEVH